MVVVGCDCFVPSIVYWQDLIVQFEGWENFDERRRLKHQKQLDFRVTGSAEFDEGADKNNR